MDQILVCIIMLICWVLGIVVGCCLMTKYKKDFGTAGSLIVCTDDPDGPYIFFESGIPIDELLKHDTVKLSVREFTSQK